MFMDWIGKVIFFSIFLYLKLSLHKFSGTVSPMARKPHLGIKTTANINPETHNFFEARDLC